MSSAETVSGLAAFDQRGAGTDSERRAALWLADRLADSGREVLVETFWCRPNWALAQLWHGVLALIGSLVAVHNPRVGGVLVLVALMSTVCDAVFGTSLGRRLTPERASQNVVALPPVSARRRRVALILTAGYDAGRAGLADRDRFRRPAARLRSRLGGICAGWIFWFVLALVWLLAVAIARYEGSNGPLIGVLQLLPTIAMVLISAALLELGTADYSPAAGDNASGVAATLALAAALDAAPPEQAAVHVVLTGAGDRAGLGLRRYLRDRRRSLKAHNTVVVGIAPCAHGEPRYWVSDGQFIPTRHFKPLRTLCEETAAADPGLGLKPYRGRGASPALPGRLAGIPSVAIGSLDPLGLSPHSHQQSDTADTVERTVLDLTVEVGLLLAEEIDAYLARLPAPEAAAPSPPPRTQRPAKARRKPARRLF
jgi:hypothetical protein